MQNSQNFISIYIHWPFCLAKCPYCDFNSHVANKFDHKSWLEAYKKEIRYFQNFIQNRYIKSIFFGGGTPSLMDPSIPAGIIELLSNIGTIDSNTEITLEANPTSVEAGKFESFRKAGINRVSVGVQSLIEADLQKLGRKHNSLEAINAIKLAKEIFPRFSFDLIYAREGQNLLSWKEELKLATELAGDHISLYQLTIEKATPFYSMYQKGKLILPESDIAADMYEWTLDYLRGLGYKRYEISNYAYDGFESRHNLAYWHYDEYLGIGPGAHSRIYLDNQNLYGLMNYHKPEKWLELVNENGHGLQSKNILTDLETLEEIIMMGMRLESGITDEKLRKYLGKGFSEALNIDEIEKLVKSGFVKFDEKKLALTDKGLLMHSSVIAGMLV
jgi:putative oxygen-independent coproporphyrinogen III oxidase